VHVRIVYLVNIKQMEVIQTQHVIIVQLDGLLIHHQQVVHNVLDQHIKQKIVVLRLHVLLIPYVLLVKRELLQQLLLIVCALVVQRPSIRVKMSMRAQPVQTGQSAVLDKRGLHPLLLMIVYAANVVVKNTNTKIITKERHVLIGRNAHLVNTDQHPQNQRTDYALIVQLGNFNFQVHLQEQNVRFVRLEEVL
jgi:hypothetical protein